MLNKDIDIIALTKDKLVHVQVNPASRKLKGIAEYGWSYDTLDIILEKVKKKTGNKLRMLVSDDLSYVVRMEIPEGTDNERGYIKENLPAHIPERLADRDWDFKVLRFNAENRKEKQKNREVIIFALVKRLFIGLGEAAEKIGLTIEAIEPEAIAKTRDSNPLIGLALKEDLEGKDEDVLNITPTKSSVQKEEGDDEEVERLKEEVEEEREEIEELEKKNTLLKTMIAVSVLLLFAAILYLGYEYFVNDRQSGTVEDGLTAPTSTPATVTGIEQVTGPAQTQVPENTTGAELSELSLLIQNGSGEAGEATFIEEILASEGFENIETENADNFDYTETSVSLIPEVDAAVYEVIERALNSDYIVVRGESLPEDFGYDIVVIIGERR